MTMTPIFPSHSIKYERKKEKKRITALRTGHVHTALCPDLASSGWTLTTAAWNNNRERERKRERETNLDGRSLIFVIGSVTEKEPRKRQKGDEDVAEKKRRKKRERVRVRARLTIGPVLVHRCTSVPQRERFISFVLIFMLLLVLLLPLIKQSFNYSLFSVWPTRFGSPAACYQRESGQFKADPVNGMFSQRNKQKHKRNKHGQSGQCWPNKNVGLDR